MSARPSQPALDQFDVLVSGLLALRREFGDETPVARVYLEGAMGNLRHARDAMLFRRPDLGSSKKKPAYQAMDAFPLDDRGTWLRRIRPDAEVGRRCVRSANGAFVDDAAKDGGEQAFGVPPSPGLDLVADVMSDQDVRALVTRPMFAAMLWQALAFHSWYNTATAASWSTDREGARVAVTALCGFIPQLIPYDRTAGLLDEEVVGALRTLGWCRHRTPALLPAVAAGLT